MRPLSAGLASCSDAVRISRQVHLRVCGERHPKRLNGRERYLPLLPETIETLFEI